MISDFIEDDNANKTAELYENKTAELYENETHTFLDNDWTRVSISDLTDWTKIVNLDVRKMDIVSVKANLRISYIK